MIIKTLGRLATGKNILILLALFLLANLVVVPLVYPRFQTLDMLNGYTPAQANQLIASYGQQGRQSYAIVEATLDLAYPFVSGMLFSLLTLYSFQRGFPNQKWAQMLALLPLAVMLADYLENVCVLVLLLGYPHELAAVARVANFFTTAKMVLSPFEILFVLGFIGWFFRFIWIKLKV
jgi:hypothetical protein